MSKKENINTLIFDDKNFNKGSEYGKSLIDKSFQKFGAGRSILVDKNNKIIAGNKSAESFGENGNEEIQIVESDGSKLIVVKRTDIDLDTPEGREMALADNAAAKANIVFDFDTLESELEDVVIEDWGIETPKEYSSKNKEIDLDEYSDEMFIKLKYTEKEYIEVKEALSKIAKTPEKAVWKLLGK